MTVTNNDRRIRTVASASQTEFPVDFPIDDENDIVVTQQLASDSSISTLTVTTDYTVALDGDAPNTGTVTLVTGAAVNDIIVIEGQRTADRDTDFITGGDFLAATVNTGEDRQFWHIQELTRDLDRALKLNVVTADTFDPELPDMVAGKLLQIKSDLTGFELVSVSDLGSTLAAASDSNPQAVGTADAGTSDNYSRADHVHALPNRVSFKKGSDIASAAALTLGSDGNYFDVTGTTAITSIGTVAVGTVIKLHFDGALTLTHHATDLILPGAANITTAAGDEAEFVEYATGDWRCTNYSKASGAAVVDTDLGNVGEDIVPGTDSTHDLGSATKAFAEAHADEVLTDTFTDRSTDESVDAIYMTQGTIKGWSHYDHTVPSVLDSLNVSSVTDTATGRATHNWNTDFDAADGYAVMADYGETGGNGNEHSAFGFTAPAAGSRQIHTALVTTATDSPDHCCSAVGTLV